MLERHPETKELVALRLEPHQIVRARVEGHEIELRQGTVDVSGELEE